jgi:hypothetical protein
MVENSIYIHFNKIVTTYKYIKFIPSGYWLNIATACKISSNEIPLVLLDNSLLGSGESRIAITTWGIRTWGMKSNGAWELSWETISKYKVTINNENLLLHDTKKSEPIMKFSLPYFSDLGRLLLQNIITNGAAIFGKGITNIALPMHERRIIVITNNASELLDIDIPQFTVAKAKELFKFPPNHPIAGAAYAMCEVLPDNYVQLDNFHDFVKDSKQSAFFDLCASLGAKEIRVESVMINNQELDINSDINTPLAKAGFNLNIKQSSEDGSKIAMTYGEGNNKIKEYDSPWIDTEQSWRSMIKGRKESDMKTYFAEFNHTDDMGIDAKLTAKLLGYGINIVAKFTEMTKVKLRYRVIFW